MLKVRDGDTLARVRAALYRAADDFLSCAPIVVEIAADTSLTLLVYASALFGLVYGLSLR